MNPNRILVCCVVLAAALTACQGKSSAPAEREPGAATPAEGESEAAEPADEPVTVVRNLKRTSIEVNTSAPVNVGAVPEDAKRSKSGLAWVVPKKGTGEAHPGAGDTAVVNFIGWTTDGKLFDESLTHGGPGAIAVERMFPGLAEGVQLMVEGEKRRLWIPGELAFGEAKPAESAPGE